MVLLRRVADDGSKKLGKQKGYFMMTEHKVSADTFTAERNISRDADGTELEGRGVGIKLGGKELVDSVGKMEHPVMWVHYLWRKRPEIPAYELPCPNALKNVQGALISDLSPIQQRRRNEMLHTSVSVEDRLQDKFTQKHPFLAMISKERAETPTGFPFWYKKYPSRRYANEARFSIPTEMLAGMPAEVQTAVAPHNMTIKERIQREKNIYAIRYGEHPLDTGSPAVNAVNLAIEIREMRNTILAQPHLNGMKRRLAKYERGIAKVLRRLRRVDFRRYWEILRDHDVMDLVQPFNHVQYRHGNYWFHDWKQGYALSTDIADFMDPRGMQGCLETGRSRAEVARDLGLSYTRTLTEVEKTRLSNNAMYFERLNRFKREMPQAWRDRERMQFVSKVSGMYSMGQKKALTNDYPSVFRREVGTRTLRWKSKRHGPT